MSDGIAGRLLVNSVRQADGVFPKSCSGLRFLKSGARDEETRLVRAAQMAVSVRRAGRLNGLVCGRSRPAAFLLRLRNAYRFWDLREGLGQLRVLVQRDDGRRQAGQRRARDDHRADTCEDRLPDTVRTADPREAEHDMVAGEGRGGGERGGDDEPEQVGLGDREDKLADAQPSCGS